MRAKVVKELRRVIYGDWSRRNLFEYAEGQDGVRRCSPRGMRSAYLEAKKQYVRQGR